MSFNSLTYAIFFAVVFILHQLPLPWRVKKINLLIASFVFYGSWNPPFLLLLWFSTVLDWSLAKMIYRAEGTGPRRVLLVVSLLANFGLLAFFKYGQFILENYAGLARFLGVDFTAPAFDIILPVGISFYTFQTLSYTLDVYMKKTVPAKSFLDYCLYIAFFPQLVAGPIVRSENFLPQCEAPRQANLVQFKRGVTLIILGLFQKIVVADFIMAPAVEKVFHPGAHPGWADAWLGTLAFTCQIFCDFSGYSTVAIGSALCLGFKLIRNFRSPYGALGFSDFWRRWHISLSTWLRDYLYIPLGGNRGGAVKVYRNIMVTMLLGGLWHGASWTFVVWGGIHGALLCFERILQPVLTRGSRFPGAKLAGWIFTFLAVCVTWVFFRAKSLGQAGEMIAAMFGQSEKAAAPVLLTPFEVQSVLWVSVFLVLMHWLLRSSGLHVIGRRVPSWLWSMALTGLVLLIWLTAGEDRAFIYFQF